MTKAGNTEPGIVTDSPHPFFVLLDTNQNFLSPNISKQHSFSEKSIKAKLLGVQLKLFYSVCFENKSFTVFQACKNLSANLCCACTAQETKFQKIFFNKTLSPMTWLQIMLDTSPMKIEIILFGIQLYIEATRVSWNTKIWKLRRKSYLEAFLELDVKGYISCCMLNSWKLKLYY